MVKKKVLRYFKLSQKRYNSHMFGFWGFFYYIADTSFKQAREMMQKKLE